MSLVERVERDGVVGIRVGRFRNRLNTTCWVWRLNELLIDTGPPNQWPVIRSFARERETRRAIVTHHHEDHGGNLGRLGEELGLETLAPAAALHPLAAGYEVQLYRRVIWGRPRRVHARPLPRSLELESGRTLVRLSTPGHSPDMTCLLEPSRGLLFAGDLYIAARTRYMRADENVHQQIRSLRRIAENDFELLYCGHRGVVENGPRAIRRKLDYLISLRQQVLDLRRSGRSVRRITHDLLGSRDPFALITRGHFSQANLVRACLAPDELPSSATEP